VFDEAYILFNFNIIFRILILLFIKLIKYKIVVFDEAYILFNFNIIHKHNEMSFTKIITKATVALK
jgi:hypothetical protein